MPDGWTQARTDLIEGTWGHVSPGCAPMATENDFAAHFNFNADVGGTADFPQACMLAEYDDADQEVRENPSNDGKKCGGTNAAERVFDLRGGSATLAACNTACVSDPSCVAFSAIFGSWCIGCSVPLAIAHGGATAYLKQPPVCSATCGGGTQSRSYSVTQEPENGGTACPTDSPQSQACSRQACAVDCTGQWSDWDVCSKDCGGGMQERVFAVTIEMKNGGAACAGDDGATESQACNADACACRLGTSFAFQATGPCGTVTDGDVSEQNCTDETLATSDDLGGVIESGVTQIVDCSRWHADYHGSFHLSCNDGDITVDDGNTCQLNNPCATEEDNCADEATCTHTGIGTHTCECQTGAYGDALEDSAGCTACPANSQSDTGTAAITGCVCDAGYVSGDDNGTTELRMLAGDGSTCEKLVCPTNSAAGVSDGAGNAQQCACNDGYAGTITFERSSVEGTVESGTNAYSGTCTPRTCDGSAVAPEHTDGTISDDSTATKVPDQVFDSTLVFTCSAGYSGQLTYTCGQDGSFTAPDTCTGNVFIQSGKST